MPGHAMPGMPCPPDPAAAVGPVLVPGPVYSSIQLSERDARRGEGRRASETHGDGTGPRAKLESEIRG